MESHQFDHISHVLCAILEELQAVRGCLEKQAAQTFRIAGESGPSLVKLSDQTPVAS